MLPLHTSAVMASLTGEQASHQKVQSMGVRPLAVSGVGVEEEQLKQFIKEATVFLAATALSSDCEEHGVIDKCESSFCDLHEGRLKQWVETVRKLEAVEMV